MNFFSKVKCLFGNFWLYLLRNMSRLRKRVDYDDTSSNDTSSNETSSNDVSDTKSTNTLSNITPTDTKPTDMMKPFIITQEFLDMIKSQKFYCDNYLKRIILETFPVRIELRDLDDSFITITSGSLWLNTNDPDDPTTCIPHETAAAICDVLNSYDVFKSHNAKINAIVSNDEVYCGFSVNKIKFKQR